MPIVIGPRQVGKTTIAQTVGRRWEGPVRYASADALPAPGREWIETHWALARGEASQGPALLILDEVQKIHGWSDTVKALWDEELSRAIPSEALPLRVVLVGSSALLLSRGATESLVGRFFMNRCPHWSHDECRETFGWNLDQWIYFGGYPGAAALIGDEDEWRTYITDSLIETAFLLSGLERFSAGHARSRGSSPKLVFWNNGLVNAMGSGSFRQIRSEPDLWGRLVENAVGAHLLNHLQGLPYEITYWRHHRHEVDYVVRSGRHLWIIEVKSGRPRTAPGRHGAGGVLCHGSRRDSEVSTGGAGRPPQASTARRSSGIGSVAGAAAAGAAAATSRTARIDESPAESASICSPSRCSRNWAKGRTCM